MMHSRDGRWRVRVISLDGTQYLRLAHDTLTDIPGGIPLHSDGHHRFGPVRVADGWLIGDFTSPEQLEKYVRLEELVNGSRICPE